MDADARRGKSWIATAATMSRAATTPRSGEEEHHTVAEPLHGWPRVQGDRRTTTPIVAARSAAASSPRSSVIACIR